jgi:hypothetical protein
MSRVRRVVCIRTACAAVALLACGLGPANAQDGDSVRGHLKLLSYPPSSTMEISINAWIDDDGEAQGNMTWVGGVFKSQPGGPADPWELDVIDLEFSGNTAYVTAVVTHSVHPADIGTEVFVWFTDNSGTGAPDEFTGQFAAAGNVTVSD